MDAFCQEKGFVKWFETSAKEDINIEAAARFLISEVTSLNHLFRRWKFLLQIMKHAERPDPQKAMGSNSTGKVKLADEPNAPAAAKGGCCS